MNLIERRDYQISLKEQTYAAWQQGHRNVLNVLPTGGGKCHGRDTPILMFDGTIKMVQNIDIGDLVMGPDSQSRLVINISKGFDDLYNVIPLKGDPYIVNSSHILSLRRTNERSIPKHPCQKRTGEIVNISIKDFIEKSKTFKHLHKGWRTSVRFSENQPKFDPYMLGLWLGDGSARIASITTNDDEIKNYCEFFASFNGMRIREEKKKGTDAVNIHFVKFGKKTNTSRSYMHKFLMKYNLIQNKHVPHEYKTSSESSRLRLLAGIIDTDGSYTGKGFDYISISEKLADDVIFIARSLGFSAYKKKCRKTCVNNGVVGDYYRCTISGNVEKIPTLIKRKQAKPRKQKKNVLLTGLTVKKIGIGEYFGFQVLGSDSLYLLGDFTVTHNSIIVSDIVNDGAHYNMRQCVIAHRNELVSQMSAHIARRGIYHQIIGSDSTVAQIRRMHRTLFNQQFVHPTAPTSVVGVDTLISRKEERAKWAAQQDRWIGDECHHFIGNDRTPPNKWGKAIAMMPNAYGLGVTATPVRADGQGLGREYDGPFDVMICGPTMRQLIDCHYLCDYEIVCPSSDLKVTDEEVSADGDWSSKTLKKAAKQSHIVGDVVENYCKYAFGRRTIVFATDTETAAVTARKFTEWNITAAALSAETPSAVREKYINEFKSGKLTVLINVDLFDEGFDVPECDVVIMARPTASLGKYRQMCGRALRYVPGKVALIIDMVSNIIRHRYPDHETIWTLARRDKRGKQVKDPDEIPLTTCVACTKPYERYMVACPYCGMEKPLPSPRDRTLEMVEGDLILLDREMLARMRNGTLIESPTDVGSRVAHVAGGIAGQAAVKRQMDKVHAHQELQEVMAQWAGIEKARGFSDREIMRRFYHTAGMDVVTALDANRPASEMRSITETIKGWWNK